jgi:hypothetical protein
VNKPSRAQARPLSQLVAKTISDAFAKQGFASTGLVTHWEEIVGSEIAAYAEPMRMQWPRRVHEEEPDPATLTLRVEGPVALEIQHLSGTIVERVNRYFGWRAVGRIVIRQAPLARRAKKKVRPPAPDAVAVARVAASMSDIADEGLRDALARLGAAVQRR